MNLLKGTWQGSPTAVRIIPFLVFVALTALQGKLFENSEYWLYLIKTLAVAVLVWSLCPRIAEMRWAFSWEAVVAGIAVFILWVGLDGFYPPLPFLKKGPLEWNPFNTFGPNSALAWMFIVGRIAGSTLLVPMIEEVFYRSFFYRSIAAKDFTAVPLGAFHTVAFLATSAVFGSAHFEWLPGILCGMIYQYLVVRKKRLGDAMFAHAITNLLLGLWVVWKGEWHFW